MTLCTFYEQLGKFLGNLKNNEFKGKFIEITGREETTCFRKSLSSRNNRLSVCIFSSPTSAKFTERTWQVFAENNTASRMSRNSVGCTHPRTQRLRSPWPAVGKRTTLERSHLKSENIGLPVELRMPRRQKQTWQLKSKYSYRVGEVCSSSIVVEVAKKGVSHKDKHLGILKDYNRWDSIKKRDNLAELRSTEPVSNSASRGFIKLNTKHPSRILRIVATDVQQLVCERADGYCKLSHIFF